MRAEKINGTVESLKVSLKSETRLAESIPWMYRGARQLAPRCGDVAIWDSTHNLSRYSKHLSMICLTDSVAKTRLSVFHLTSHEKGKNNSEAISFWISSFQLPIQPELSTDRDIAMDAAICAMSYSNPSTVFSCIFHLFYINLKKKVLPVLTVSGKGASSLAGFKKGIR